MIAHSQSPALLRFGFTCRWSPLSSRPRHEARPVGTGARDAARPASTGGRVGASGWYGGRVGASGRCGAGADRGLREALPVALGVVVLALGEEALRGERVE